MCDTNKNTIGSFGLGFALGVGASFFLYTKRGRKLVSQAWKELEPYVDELEDYAKEGLKQAEKVAQSGVKKIKDQAEQVKNMAQEKAKFVSQKAMDMLDEVQIEAEELKDKAKNIKDDMVKTGEGAVSQIKDFVSQNPVQSRKPPRKNFFRGV